MKWKNTHPPTPNTAKVFTRRSNTSLVPSNGAPPFDDTPMKIDKDSAVYGNIQLGMDVFVKIGMSVRMKEYFEKCEKAVGKPPEGGLLFVNLVEKKWEPDYSQESRAKALIMKYRNAPTLSNAEEIERNEAYAYARKEIPTWLAENTSKEDAYQDEKRTNRDLAVA